jgi:hypothetical protein
MVNLTEIFMLGFIKNIGILIKLGILVLTGLIIFNLHTEVTLFGGKSAKLIGLGIFLISLEAVDKALEFFQIDVISMLLNSVGEELFHDLLKFLGLILIAWGLSRLSQAIKLTQKR